MSVVETVTAVVTALGGGAGIANLITALRHRTKPDPDDGGNTKQKPVTTVATLHVAPSYSVGDGASWSVGLGMLACLLAATLVVIIGATATPLHATRIVVLEWTVVAVAVPAIAVGGWSRYRPNKPGRATLTWRVSAGFLAACGALIATLIAGVH